MHIAAVYQNAAPLSFRPAPASLVVRAKCTIDIAVASWHCLHRHIEFPSPVGNPTVQCIEYTGHILLCATVLLELTQEWCS